MNNKPKTVVNSKTIIFNVIMTLILVAELLPTVVPNSPEWVLPVSVGVMGIGNIVLRVWFTTQPVESFK